MTHDDAFLDAILAEPQQDVHRLVYADWLEERGQSERGEFIRVQCQIERLENTCDCCGLCEISEGFQLPRPCKCGITDLRRREREFLSCGRAFEFAGDWQRRALPGSPAVHYEGNGRCRFYHNRLEDSRFAVTFRRGFVTLVSCTLADWCGRECDSFDCQQRRRHCGQAPDWCALCHGTGHVGRHGPALCRAAPLEVVRLTDRKPARRQPVYPRVLDVEWSWDALLIPEFRLPSESFNTEQAALDAMSAWLLTWARAQDSLAKPLVPACKSSPLTS